jgi:hypothetical protein
MKSQSIHVVRDAPVQMSHIALLSELVKRASDRIQSLQETEAFDQDRTLYEVRLITARINEIIGSM